MAETILINAQAGTLPEGFCPKGPDALQELYEKFISLTQFSLAVGIRFFNFGDTEPTPDMRIWPWFKTVGGYPDRWYVYTGSPGGWYSLHPIPAGPSGLRCGWAGTPDELLVYDGGLNELTTLVSGPFWEIDHDFDGRSPMGPGLIPNANPAKTLSVGEDYGEGAHLLTASEVPLADIAAAMSVAILIPGHGGEDGTRDACDGGTDSPPLTNDAAAFPGYGPDGNNLPQVKITATQPGPAGTPVASHNTIHPVRGLYQIKRTIRKYFRGT